VQQVQRARKVFKVLKERLAQQVRWGHKEFKENKELKERRVLKECKVHKEYRESKVRREQQEIRA